MPDKTPERRAARAFRELEKASFWGADPPRGAKAKMKRCIAELARATGERAPRGWHWSIVREDRMRPWDATITPGEVTLCLVRDDKMILHRDGIWTSVYIDNQEEIASGDDLAAVARLTDGA